ncbi:MAG: hypothetical protein KC478_14210, partial [Bacteriovoracaceae bacterium]|nr:hypothetical protein [Bacteriovoracaceae bacterium]
SFIESLFEEIEVVQGVVDPPPLPQESSEVPYLREEIDHLKKELKFKNVISEAKQSGITYDIIFDQEHQPALKNFFRKATNELYISSGWVGKWALENINVELQRTLSRGVNVHLFYGYNHSGDHDKEAALLQLETLQGHFPNLYVYDVHEKWHAKAVVVDDKIASIGSFNWLSNTGNSSKEFSMIAESEEMAQKFKDQFFSRAIKMSKAS